MNLGFPEMMFIFILALILFGPKKLPEIGRQIGKGLAEFKRASREFQSQIEDEVRKLEIETDLNDSIKPTPIANAIASTPPALTTGSQPEIQPPITTASSAEVAAAAAHADYIDGHSSPKADSAGNA